MRKFSTAVLTTVLLLLPSALSAAAGEPGAADGGGIKCKQHEGDEEDGFATLFYTSYIKIDGVEFATPTAGMPCIVTAKLSEITEDDSEENAGPIVSASLFYSVDGGPEQEAGMKKGTASDWKGEIPGVEGGRHVEFYINAVEHHCNTTSGAISSNKTFARGYPDGDNFIDLAPDDMDLLELGANYDKDYIYIRFTVQGNITAGSVEPPHVNVYGLKLSNPDIDNEGGLLILYVPMFKEQDKRFQFNASPFAKSIVDKYDAEHVEKARREGLFVLNIGKWLKGDKAGFLVVSGEPEVAVSGETLTAKINRSVLGDNPSGMVRIFAATAANASIDGFQPIPYDMSNYFNLYMKSYGYTVQ